MTTFRSAVAGPSPAWYDGAQADRLGDIDQIAHCRSRDTVDSTRIKIAVVVALVADLSDGDREAFVAFCRRLVEAEGNPPGPSA